MIKISIIIPTFNEADNIEKTLQSLQAFRKSGHEVIIADANSTDQTIEITKALVDKVINTPIGRAKQMNAGAELATGDLLLFLHADTLLPADADQIIYQATHAINRNIDDHWGRFDLEFTGKHSMFKVIAFFINWRSRLTGIATGDQAIFISKTLYKKIDGFPDIPLMEDIAICKKLLRIKKPVYLKNKVTSSSRRWEQQGIFRTIVHMWYLRLAFYFGVSPDRLVKRYYPHLKKT